MTERVFGVAEIAETGLDGWHVVLPHLEARFATGDFDTGLDMVNRIAIVAREMNHHPDLDLRYSYLDVRLLSHDIGALTQRDVDLAGQIAAIATDLGIDTDAPN